MMRIKSVEWVPDTGGRICPGRVRILDQTRLPRETVFIETCDLETVFRAIRSLQVRGAPAIGIAAAMGIAASAQNSAAVDGAALAREAARAADRLAESRPTAVNLFWAVERMKRKALDNSGLDPAALKELLAGEAVMIRDEDAAMCRAIGEHGARLIPDGASVLTYCNAGALAASELGTALAPIYVAAEQGKRVRVYSCETRPLLQGSRLTVWELMQAGIDVTLICDNMAGKIMKDGQADIVCVGADRIAANGDTANKIGTYGLAVLARAHGIPFYVFAPSSTFDPDSATGADIPVEERDPEEITQSFGRRTAPAGVKVYAPAFDVTPAGLITAIVSERGAVEPGMARPGAAVSSE